MQRNLLRKGAVGNSVLELQKLLNKALSPSPNLVIDSKFGEKTHNAVLIFQRSAKIKIDGIVGKNTWRSLVDATSHQVRAFLPQFLLADIASSYLGVQETGTNMAGTDKQMLEIFDADDLFISGKTDGYPWCAAFVSLCVQKLCQQSAFYAALNPPREPSVNQFLNTWSKQNNCLIFGPNDNAMTAIKGDIIVFTFSHIGIVESNQGATITTIEGNTNAAGSREGVMVARKSRSPSIVRSFIRLPMTTIGVDRSIQNIVLMC